MSTSLLAIISGIAYGIYRLYLSHRKEGWGGVKKNFFTDGFHAVIFGICWWALIFAYHFFYKVPSHIRLDANSQVAPAFKSVIMPPQGWERKSFRPKSKNSIPIVAMPRLHEGNDPFVEFNNVQLLDWSDQIVNDLHEALNEYEITTSQILGSPSPNKESMRTARNARLREQTIDKYYNQLVIYRKELIRRVHGGDTDTAMNYVYLKLSLFQSDKDSLYGTVTIVVRDLDELRDRLRTQMELKR